MDLSSFFSSDPGGMKCVLPYVRATFRERSITNMLRLKKILCPTDFSEYSGRALKYAEKLAGPFKARLYVQHVVEDLVVMAPDMYASLTDFQSLRVTYRQEVI